MSRILSERGLCRKARIAVFQESRYGYEHEFPYRMSSYHGPEVYGCMEGLIY